MSESAAAHRCGLAGSAVTPCGDQLQTWTGRSMFFTSCLPLIDEGDGDAAAHMLVDAVGDRDAARLGEPLDAGGDVDAVAKEVVAVDHHVAEIDADAQHDRRRVRLRPRWPRSSRAADAAAHSTALTALPNSTNRPSPVRLKMRP